jgi:hypothetical protein
MKTLAVVAALAWLAVPPQDHAFLISHFDGKTIDTRSGLSLWPYADDLLGGTSEARSSLIQPGANGSRGALRMDFHLTSEFVAPFSSTWAMVAPEGLTADVSAYRGLRFYARSATPTAFYAGVVRFAGQIRRYTTTFEASTAWTLIELPFDRFREVPPPGAPASSETLSAPRDVTSVGFGTAPKLQGDFRLEIDRVEFYR